MEEVDAALALGRVEIVPMPRAALFLAGKVFQKYRASGGTRTGVLPDFFIGAHAAIAKVTLLTRDVQRYRSYFPSIQLIAPMG
jgi:predicted nucleic acid-binding protein